MAAIKAIKDKAIRKILIANIPLPLPDSIRRRLEYEKKNTYTKANPAQPMMPREDVDATHAENTRTNFKREFATYKK